MATPQRSRYPRPLKATHTFAGGSGASAPGSGTPGQAASGAGSPSPGSLAAGCQAAAVSSSPPPPSNGVRRCASSPEWRSPVVSNRGEAVGESHKTTGQLHPRRSNSMGSLSEPDCYMNALWPRLSAAAAATQTTPQCDGEEFLSSSDDADLSLFTHKRSNSCSSADRLKVSKPLSLKNGLASAAHTRKSVEGLNQEVSSALAGNPILLVETTHPDGHVAPVQDLLGSSSIGMQTPPSFGAGGGGVSSQTPSPFPQLSSSPAATHMPTASDSTHSGTNRESPASLHHPPSPKPSFAREPPDGAERCTIKVETSVHCEGYVPRGPDKSKGTIVFKGTAFAPPLHSASRNMQAVP